MRKSFFLPFLVTSLAALGLFLSPLYAQRQSSRTRNRSTTTSSKSNDTYTVVQIGDDFRVINSSDLKEEKKRIEDDYKKLVKEWEDRKKIDPDAERPTKPIVKIKMSNFKTQTIANEYARQLQEEADKKNPNRKKKQGYGSGLPFPAPRPRSR